MGVYDEVKVECPKCGTEAFFQSKSGPCVCEIHELNDAPDDVLENVNRHSPYECDCGCRFGVDRKKRQAVECLGDWCDLCDAPQTVSGATGEHFCGESDAVLLKHNVQTKRVDGTTETEWRPFTKRAPQVNRR